ncbi:D-alanine--D-alanine ligase [Alphaproteobacteria bacterium]
MKRIVLLAGGLSSEREVSLMSANSVRPYLEEMGYKVIMVDAGVNLAEELKKYMPDLVFNCLHGTYGEDGAVQGLLEVMQVPYTHSGVRASAVAFSKDVTKYIATYGGIRTPKFIVIDVDEYFAMLKIKQDPMSKPYVLKPIAQGSTVGIYIVLDDSSILPNALEWKFGPKVIVEEYILGIDLFAAVIRDKACGVIEVRPKSGFYDYTAKYTEGAAEHVMPADVPSDVYQCAMLYAEKMHKLLDCRTISRSDFRYDPRYGTNGLYFLEINTHPGFTDMSLFPEIAKYSGISFVQIIQMLLEDAQCEL